MSDTPANPVFVALLFILRCFVPLAVLFGISYLLRKLGLVAETPEPPSDYDDDSENQTPPNNQETSEENKRRPGA